MININNQETGSSIHSRIIRQHEREVVKTLRGLEKTTRKLACLKNHRYFNTRCLTDNVISKSLHIRSTVKGIKASTILRNAERKLLNIRISQCHFTVSKLQNEKELLEANRRTKLTETEMEELTAFIEHAHETTFRETRERQQRKYDQLLSKQQHGADIPQLDEPDNITERWVINLANIHLDSVEVSLLKKGLNVAVTPQNLPIDDLIMTTELVCKNIKEKHRADGLRCEVAKAVMKHKAKKKISNISLEERKALQTLRSDKTIKILPADKGRATVIMKAIDYDAKIAGLLVDDTTYKKLERDPTKVYKSKLVNTMKEWKRTKTITDALYYRIYPTSETVTKFYGLPKVQKNNVPLRPIVSSIDNITYKTAKFLAIILSPLVGKTEHFVKNSIQFVKKIKELEVPPGRKMVYFDVKALFTSLPVTEAVSVI